MFVYGDSYIFSAAIGILKYLEPHLLQQDEMTVGKLLKNIVACRMQFEQDHSYPIEAYERTTLWRECKLVVISPKLVRIMHSSMNVLINSNRCSAADFKIVNGIASSRTDSKRWQTFKEQLLGSREV